MGHSERRRPDFFVSYTQADRAWAEWIAWTVEDTGFRVMVQAWDFQPGINWIQGMHAWIQDAARTIAVLSPDYLKSVYGAAEWQAAWAQDPGGTGQKLLTIRVSDCGRPGLLAGVVGIDLFGIDEKTARSRLREMVTGTVSGRAKPTVAPGFPGGGQSMQHPQFPGAPASGPAVDPAEQESTGGGSVTHLRAFRHQGGRDSIDSPDAELLQSLIAEFSDSAQLVSTSYATESPEYIWTRLKLNRQLAQIKSQVEQIRKWLARAGMEDDLATFDLRYSLRQYASTADEFAGALDGLESGKSPSSHHGLLDEYEGALRPLEVLLWRIHREFMAARLTPGPSGLR